MRYVIDDRERNLFQVNRDAFVSQDILDKERSEIFDKTWIYVGHESELPNKNDFHTREVAGRPVIFVRDRNGQVRVHVNTCLHRGASLCRHKSGNQKIFTCFYHGWAYRNSGELVSVPAEDDYTPSPKETYGSLPDVRLEEYRGFYFANFDPDAEPLVDWLGEAAWVIDLVTDQSPEGLQVVEGTHNYSLQANWKLLVENSIDGYHAKSVHHTYFEMMLELGMAPPMLSSRSVNGIGPAGWGTELGNGHTSLMYPGNGLPLFNEKVAADREEAKAKALETFGEARMNAMFELGRNSVIFPNLIAIDLNFGMVLRTMYPVEPGFTKITSWQIVPKGIDEENLTYRIDNSLTFWGPAGMATPDDVEALEQAQKAFSTRQEMAWSDISKGMGKERPAANDELQMRGWWREWNKRITGEELPPEAPIASPFGNEAPVLAGAVEEK